MGDHWRHNDEDLQMGSRLEYRAEEEAPEIGGQHSGRSSGHQQQQQQQHGAQRRQQGEHTQVQPGQFPDAELWADDGRLQYV